MTLKYIKNEIEDILINTQKIIDKEVKKIDNFYEDENKIIDILKEGVKYVDDKNMSKKITSKDNEKKIKDLFKKYVMSYICLYPSYFNTKGKEILTKVVNLKKVEKEILTIELLGKINLQIDTMELIKKELNIKQKGGAVKKEAKSMKKLDKDNKDNKEEVKDIEDLVPEEKKEQEQREQERKRNKIINGVNVRMIEEYMKVGKKSDLPHIITYTIIVFVEYVRDKIDILKIVNDELFRNSETTTIEISYPIESYIDLLTIEGIYGENRKKYAEMIYELIEEDKKIKHNMDEDNIRRLINTEIIIPITEEFLLMHNNNEKYADKDITKSKYVINKVESVKNRENTKYDGEKSIEGVYVNDTENLQVMDKLKKSMHVETNKKDYYDMKNIYNNAYINYNYFKNSGFTLDLKSTPCTSLREININSKNAVSTSKIITRTCINTINIIGFALINPENMRIKEIRENSMNMKRFVKEIYNKMTGNDYPTCYWLFDNERVDDNKELLDQNICIKLALEMYNNVLGVINNKIITEIMKNNKNITLDLEKNIIETVVKKSRIEDMIDNIELQRLVYKEASKDIIREKLEDKIFGYDEDKVELEEYKIEKEKKIRRIDTTKEEKQVEEIKYKVPLVCQHTLYWEDIEKSKNTAEDMETLLYEFSIKYVELDQFDQTICKSCGEKINITSYVIDGSYNDSKQFIPTGVEFAGDITKYEAYKKYTGNDGVINKLNTTIKNIGQIIGLNTITKDRERQKYKRNEYIKNIIDLLTENNNILLTRKYIERNKYADKAYNISHDKEDIYKSDLFVFTLDNTVYKENNKDFNLKNKRNNIFLYTLVVIAIDLDINNIIDIVNINIKKNELCSFKKFKAVREDIFKDTRIRINNRPQPIRNYILLEYIIYLMAVILANYNVYSVDIDIDQSNKQNMNKIKKIKMMRIINSMIDIINTIMENKEYLDNNDAVYNSYTYQIYNLITHKINLKVEKLYNNPNEIMKLVGKDTITVAKDNIEKKAIKVGDYKDYEFKRSKEAEYLTNKRNYVDYNESKLKSINYTKLKYTDNVFCKDGEIHDWKLDKDGVIKCKKCGISKEHKKMKSDSKIKEKYEEKVLERLSTRYCKDGTPHTKIIDNNKIYCKKCGYIFNKDKEVSTQDLKTLKKNYYKDEIQDNSDINKTTDYKEIYNKLEKEKNKYEVEDLIKVIKNKIGDVVNYNDKSYNIEEDKYIIDHNNLGYAIEEKEIPESKIKYKDNQPYFKQDVYYYEDKNKEVYYNKYTDRLIGYKDGGKYVNIDSMNIYKMKKEYSIKTMIENLFIENIYELKDKDSINETYIKVYKRAREFIDEIKRNIRRIMNKKKIDKTIVSENEYQEEHKKFDIERYYNKKIQDIYEGWEEKIKSLERIMNTDTKIENNTYYKVYEEIIKKKEIKELYSYIISEIVKQDTDMIEMIVNFIIYFFETRNNYNILNTKEGILLRNIINTSDMFDYQHNKYELEDEDDLNRLKDKIENDLLGIDEDEEERIRSEKKVFGEDDSDEEGYDMEDVDGSDYDDDYDRDIE